MKLVDKPFLPSQRPSRVSGANRGRLVCKTEAFRVRRPPWPCITNCGVPEQNPDLTYYVRSLGQQGEGA